MSRPPSPLLRPSPPPAWRRAATVVAVAALGALAAPLHASAATGSSPTTSTLTAAQSSSTYGVDAVFTIHVTTSGAAPTGIVSVDEAGTGTGSGPVSGVSTPQGSGSWSFRTNSLSVGTHQLHAHYYGDSVNAFSLSADLTFVVSQSPIVVDLYPSSNPSVPTQHVTFLASTFTPPAAPYATGSITFRDGGTDLATVQLDEHGTAAFTTGLLQQGSHSLTAAYSGDADFLPGSSAALDQVVAAATPTERFVNQLYHDILGRPSDGGAAAWVSMLDSHAVGRTQVALALSTSTEYLTDLIQDEYLLHLGRPADQPGLDYWIGYIRHGATLEDLEVSFLATPEYYAGAGGTPELFIDAVYGDVFGRVPDGQGYLYWEKRLVTGTPPWVMAASAVKSTEALTNRVTGYYQSLLGRDPDTGGRDYWVSLLKGGVHDETLVGFLAGSDEYWSLAESY